MPIWDGETWLCMRCEFVNAVLRRKCRNCGAQRQHDEPAGDIPLARREARGLAADRFEIRSFGEFFRGKGMIP